MLATLGHWTKSGDEKPPKDVEDGAQYLVAVQVATTRKDYYEYSVVTFICDEEGYAIECNGEPWGWEWCCVDFYIRLSQE